MYFISIHNKKYFYSKNNKKVRIKSSPLILYILCNITTKYYLPPLFSDVLIAVPEVTVCTKFDDVNVIDLSAVSVPVAAGFILFEEVATDPGVHSKPGNVISPVILRYVLFVFGLAVPVEKLLDFKF
jgi:hypothetical protein